MPRLPLQARGEIDALELLMDVANRILFRLTGRLHEGTLRVGEETFPQKSELYALCQLKVKPWRWFR
jgi:hypothetical protein